MNVVLGLLGILGMLSAALILSYPVGYVIDKTFGALGRAVVKAHLWLDSQYRS